MPWRALLDLASLPQFPRVLTTDSFYLSAFLKSDLVLKQMSWYRPGAPTPDVSDSDLEEVLVSLMCKEKEEETSLSTRQVHDLRMEAVERLMDAVAAFAESLDISE